MWGRRILRENQEAPRNVSTAVRLASEEDREEWEHQNITNGFVPQVGVKLWLFPNLV